MALYKLNKPVRWDLRTIAPTSTEHIERQIYKALLVPIFTKGCGVWSPTGKLEEEIESTKISILRNAAE